MEIELAFRVALIVLALKAMAAAMLCIAAVMGLGLVKLAEICLQGKVLQ
jgi:hypothetical protein